MSLNMTDFPTASLTETGARSVSEMLTPSERQLSKQNKIFIRSIRELGSWLIQARKVINLKTVNASLLR